MITVFYHDTKGDHNHWWDQLNFSTVSLTQLALEELFLEKNIKFIDALTSGRKFFFIIHTGATEHFFDDNVIHVNMQLWKTTWNEYRPYWNQIFVAFVSGGTNRITKANITMTEERHHIYSVALIDSNRNKVMTDFNQAVARLERGENVIFAEENALGYLIALSVCCQGYLAAHSDSAIKPVREALQKMGWKNLDECTRDALSSMAINKKDETEGAEWWKSLFGTNKKEDVLEESKAECNGKLPPAILSLIQVIYASSKIEQEIVANAFICLTERLKGQ